MAKSTATELSKLISQLQKKREDHVAAIEDIDAVFESLGISSTTKKRRGRKPGRKSKAATTKKANKSKATSKPKRKRKKFKQTAEQFILAQLKGKSLTTKELNAAWKKSGRGHTADMTLSKLTKDGKIKRENIKGARGSRYSAM